MNQEDFLKDVSWLSDAKLRVSMGQVGNENLPNDAASEYFPSKEEITIWAMSKSAG